MQTCKILLTRSKGVLGAGIRLQTRSIVDHSALLFDRGIVIESTWPKVRQTKFPAWLRGRNRRLVEQYIIPGDLDVDAVYDFARNQLGKPYDVSSVLRFVTRQQAHRKSHGWWFCSELIFAAIAKGGLELFHNTEPYEVSPGLLRRSPLIQLEKTYNDK